MPTTTLMYDGPTIVRGDQNDYKRLYFSLPEYAMSAPMSLQAGYGPLQWGTMLSQNLSPNSPNLGKFVPYVPASISTIYDPGRAFLAADGTAAPTVVLRTVEDTYKFAVGDQLIVADDAETSPVDLGDITDIDRDTKTITVTNNVTTAFTVTNSSYVMVKNGGTDGVADCVGFLKTTRETGTGATAIGAPATIILGNVVVYTAGLTLYDSQAATDLGAQDVGQFTHIR